MSADASTTPQERALRHVEALSSAGPLDSRLRVTLNFQPDRVSDTPAASLLARMLGIHISVAVAWQRASSGDWTTYAAEISRRTNT